MGCDIHLYVENKNQDQWVNCDNWRLDDDGKYEVFPMIIWRNYDLFSVLANIRNYGKNEYMDEPRGLPEDVCDVIAKLCGDYGIDGHSHSWFTLAELRAWQKVHPTVQHRGLVTSKQAENLDKHGILPDSWCQGTSDKSSVWRTWTEEYCPLDQLVALLEQRMKEVFWIFGSHPWKPELEDRIRIVFWFDN